MVVRLYVIFESMSHCAKKEWRVMLELFVYCQTCGGVGVVLNEEEREWLDCPALCERGFVRLTPEVCPEHEWVRYGSFDIRYHCRYCGKLGKEVMV